MSGIQRVKFKGRTAEITFGTNKMVDRSDGAFPVEVWRVYVAHDDTRTEEHKATVRLAHRVTPQVRAAGRGWRAGTKDSWVELRTPKDRA